MKSGISKNESLVTSQNSFPKYSILFQIIFGFVFAGLNFLVSLINSFEIIPLFLDTIFTATASFFGLLCGLVCATVYHALCIIIWKEELIKFIWALCSYSLVIIIRLYIRKKTKLALVDIINLIFLNAVIISIEGAFFFLILHALIKYNEDSVVRTMHLILIKNNVSIFVSSLLSRIPVNILDKGISIVGGYYSYLGIRKLYNKIKIRKSVS